MKRNGVIGVMLVLCIFFCGCSETKKETFHIGKYRLDVDGVGPSILFSDNGVCEIVHPSYSSTSHMIDGKYEENGEGLVVKAENQKYAFQIQNNSLIYDEKKSTSYEITVEKVILKDGDIWICEENK